MNNIVRQCIEQHKEGEKFFDALDEMIRTNEDIMSSLACKMWNIQEEFEEYTFFNIILSGRFGRAFLKYMEFRGFDERYFKFTVLEGSLRKNEIQDQQLYEEDFSEGVTIFIDDSFFLGRTRDKIKRMVESFGGIFYTSIVAYDGSKIKDNNVLSLYRYFDHFPSEN